MLVKLWCRPRSLVMKVPGMGDLNTVDLSAACHINLLVMYPFKK